MKLSVNGEWNLASALLTVTVDKVQRTIQVNTLSVKLLLLSLHPPFFGHCHNLEIWAIVQNVFAHSLLKTTTTVTLHKFNFKLACRHLQESIAPRGGPLRHTKCTR